MFYKTSFLQKPPRPPPRRGSHKMANKTTFFRQINPRLMRFLDVAGYERFYTIVVVCLWVVRGRDRGGRFGSGTKSISGCRLKPSSRLKTSFIIFIETDFKVGHEKLFHKIDFMDHKNL